MTLDEYRKKILREIERCGSESQAIATVEKAQRVLNNSNISERSKNGFWVELYESLGGAYTLTVESQATSSLSDIIGAAKSVIAQKVKK